MKKIIIILQSVILVLFTSILLSYMWIEEVFVLFLFSLVLSLIVFSIPILILKFFKKANLKTYLNGSFILASVLQILLVVFILWSNTPRYFTKEQIVFDIEDAQVFMEDIHPNLYANISKKEFNKFKKSIIDTIPEKITEMETNKILCSFYASFRDGHILLDLDNYLKRGRILTRNMPPYRFRIKNGKLYIKKNYYYRRNIPVGSEILKINNKPASECIKEVSRLISHETIHHLNAELESPFFWGIWNDFKNLEITYKTPENQIKTVSGSSGLFANISVFYDFTGIGFDNYSFKIINNKIGYFYLRSFENLKKLRKLLDSSFKKMKQKEIRNFIIDIRESSGGSQIISEEIMQYISPVPFNSYDVSLLKVSKELIRSNPTIDKTIYIPGSLFKQPQKISELRKNSFRFNGNCFLLTSGYSFSTALDFAAMFRYFKMGTIIGTETGGRTISFGSPHKFVLKKTKSIAKASIKKITNVGGAENKGAIVPDHIIENSIEDDINGIDRTLDYTIKLINIVLKKTK